jgi:hypothetical protein
VCCRGVGDGQGVGAGEIGPEVARGAEKVERPCPGGLRDLNGGSLPDGGRDAYQDRVFTEGSNSRPITKSGLPI